VARARRGTRPGLTVWTDPELYDLENAEDPAFDLAFWEWVVRSRAPRRMLELACGTGRLTIPLARLGVASELVALDNSEPFLERLRSRLAAEPVGTRVSVVLGSMQSPPVDGPFDLIAISFNSLAYLTAPEDRVACLCAMRGLLTDGGRLAFDLLAPRYDFLAEALSPSPPVRLDADHPAPDHGVSRFRRSYTDAYEPATQTLRSANRYEIFYEDGRVEHRIGDLDWHIYFPSELELLLEARGLEVVERYGDYERSPWNAAPGAISGWLRGMTQHEKAEAFRALHDGEPFIIPNPWDAGSAKVLAALGFKALAGTSSGFAFTLGRVDGSVGLDEVVEHVLEGNNLFDADLVVADFNLDVVGQKSGVGNSAKHRNAESKSGDSDESLAASKTHCLSFSFR
jgi:SAM-dependent methyltransferase